MRNYELIVIISPQVTEENLPLTVEKVKQSITEKGGTINEVQQWGKRKLASPIKHFLEGNYVRADFNLEPKLAMELEKNLLMSQDILRHLLIVKGEEKKG